jgi:hypothetical protein
MAAAAECSGQQGSSASPQPFGRADSLASHTIRSHANEARRTWQHATAGMGSSHARLCITRRPRPRLPLQSSVVWAPALCAPERRFLEERYFGKEFTLLAALGRWPKRCSIRKVAPRCLGLCMLCLGVGWRCSDGDETGRERAGAFGHGTLEVREARCPRPA